LAAENTKGKRLSMNLKTGDPSRIYVLLTKLEIQVGFMYY